MSTPRFLHLPPGVTPGKIETARGTFAVLEALPATGVVERGPAILLPGVTGSKEDFIAVLQTLALSGRRVLAVDLRGQYETPGGDDPAAYTCAALGADIDALAQQAGDGEPVHLVGHSFGGLVAREAVIDGRTKFGSLTLLGSGPAGITGRRAEHARWLARTIPASGLRHVWHAGFEPDALAAEVPDDILAFLRERLLANAPTGLATMAAEVVSAPDRTDELRQIELPTLVLYGEHDDGWPAETQQEMAAALGAECVVVPGAAHSPAVEAPETTAAALVRFWNTAESHAL
ncbi:alpha/beta hydrolase [Nonomuraea sp. MCN248]|uniref:Alpha/beta hydrolase n=1 Tax=Nonomuraea corallina TaxID=2989783 RepID=A0ABT4SNH9_9ACTN|nr:alpha/beta hydrolase [Nonomuraea corallina]MDA0638441.1 alpha/beta hydrolase [Nonomuraea corallina]